MTLAQLREHVERLLDEGVSPSAQVLVADGEATYSPRVSVVSEADVAECEELGELVPAEAGTVLFDIT